MLDYSIGELDALIQKAYRGAGFSWGLAQEAGAAAAALAMNGLPSAQVFAALIAAIDGMDTTRLAPQERTETLWHGSETPLCPVITGTVLTDFQLPAQATGSTLLIKRVHQPTILLPFICKLGVATTVTMGPASFLCSRQAMLQVNQNTPGDIDDVLLCVTAQTPETPALEQRALVDKASLSALLRYAHRTYVPATESSRLAGAGAGLLDND